MWLGRFKGAVWTTEKSEQLLPFIHGLVCCVQYGYSTSLAYIPSYEDVFTTISTSLKVVRECARDISIPPPGRMATADHHFRFYNRENLISDCMIVITT